MTTIDRQQFVAQQLRAMSPNSDWGSAGVDRANELAAILLRVGVTDLWMLKLIPVQVPTLQWNEDGSASYVDFPGYAFDYYGRRIGYVGTPTEPANDPAFQKVDQGYLLAWSAEGHGNVSYVIGSDASGTALRIVPIWGSSSDAGEIRQTALLALSFFAFVALPIVGISVGQSIGAAVLGPTLSATYPALTTIVGNVALSSALNGGDVQSAVENAVRSSVAGGIGSEVGGVVSLATDAPIIGSLASAATSRLIELICFGP